MDDADARLREAEHRTKNTLQLISSIVMLQGRRAEAGTRDELKALQQRIAAVSLAHRHVRDERIELSALIRELATDIARGSDREDVSLDLELEAVTVPARHAAPIALWACEAIGNAVRHAFPAGRSGRVQVALHRAADGFELSVSDDGVGLAEPPKGFGTTILQLMAQQLKASFETRAQPSCRVVVTVPVEGP